MWGKALAATRRRGCTQGRPARRRGRGGAPAGGRGAAAAAAGAVLGPDRLRGQQGSRFFSDGKFGSYKKSVRFLGLQFSGNPDWPIFLFPCS